MNPFQKLSGNLTTVYWHDVISEKYEEVTKDVSVWTDRQISEAQKKIDEVFPSAQPAEGAEQQVEKPFFESILESVTGEAQPRMMHCNVSNLQNQRENGNREQMGVCIKNIG